MLSFSTEKIGQEYFNIYFHEFQYDSKDSSLYEIWAWEEKEGIQALIECLL